MNLAPGGQGSVVFNVILGGNLSDIGTPTIVVLRNGIVTTVPVTIDDAVTGRYIGTFTVPATWIEYDKVTALFKLDYMLGTLNESLECSKTVGVVTIAPQTSEFIADLLQADQVKIGDQIVYFLKDSGQTVELHRQTITGDPCEGDVSLTG